MKAYATKVGVYPWQFYAFSVGVKASPIFVMALIQCIVCTWWWKSASKDEKNIIPGLFPSVLLHCKAKKKKNYIWKQCIMMVNLPSLCSKPGALSSNATNKLLRGFAIYKPSKLVINIIS